MLTPVNHCVKVKSTTQRGSIMATRSVITIDGVKGMYVHFDGDAVGMEVQKILDRDGNSAISTLMSKEWSYINADTPEGGIGMAHHAVDVIPNYGGFYNDTTPKPMVFAGDVFIEYVHHIDVDTLKVTTTPNN